jgi:hypothetical protein
MRIGLTGKLLLVLGLTSTLSVVGMGLAASWSFQHGFLDYLGQQELKRIRPVSDALLQAYREQGSWDFIARHPRVWPRLVDDAMAPERGNDKRSTRVPAVRSSDDEVPLHVPPRPWHRGPPEPGSPDFGPPNTGPPGPPGPFGDNPFGEPGFGPPNGPPFDREFALLTPGPEPGPNPVPARRWERNPIVRMQPGAHRRTGTHWATHHQLPTSAHRPREAIKSLLGCACSTQRATKSPDAALAKRRARCSVR